MVEETWEEITRDGDRGGIWFRCYRYDMWWDVACASGNCCQIQRFVGMGFLHSHRAYLRSTFPDRSLRVVPPLYRDITETI